MMSDAKPITAVVDETSPSDRKGIYYVVTAAILLDPDAIVGGLGSVVPPARIRPFHWATEGPTARNRMLDLIGGAGVVAHVVVHYPTGRRRQEDARGAAMRELVPLVIADGAEELIIESRSAREDGRDRRSVVEALHAAEGARIVYRWEPKSERLLWVADAVCGAVKEHLLGENDEPLTALRSAKVLDDLRYRNLDSKTA